MSTNDQTLSAALHGEALLAAQSPSFEPAIEQLRQATLELGNDVRVEAAGLLAGQWYRTLDADRARDLIVAGLLLLAGPVDGDQLVAAVRRGFEPTPTDRLRTDREDERRHGRDDTAD